MTTERPARPTLWRTCRAIANRTRLRIFALLVEQPALRVSAVADGIKISESVASEYLRHLEARGLLTVRRVGRRVEYRLSSVPSGNPTQGLVAAMRLVLRREAQPVEKLFKLATAFTHPRRVEIFRAVHTGSQTLQHLRAATHIPDRALQRHVRKLVARGFLECQRGRYSVVARSDAFGRELVRAAVE